MATNTLKARAPKRQDNKLARHLAPPTARERKVRAQAPLPTGRVGGYCRVSTLQQSEEGESLDVQRRQIEGYCTMNNFTLDKVFIERGVSGSKPLAERKEGAALLAGARIVAARTVVQEETCRASGSR
jgi:hypothetical protein